MLFAMRRIAARRRLNGSDAKKRHRAEAGEAAADMKNQLHHGGGEHNNNNNNNNNNASSLRFRVFCGIAIAATVVATLVMLTSLTIRISGYYLSSEQERKINELLPGVSRTKQYVGKPTIHFLGERHSGTKWMYDHLIDCFGSQTKVMPRTSRYKHWFQKEEDPYLIPTGSEMHVVAQFRNPYTWVEALRKIPYHNPLHDGLDWKTFVTKEYAMPRTGKDLAAMKNTASLNSTLTSTCTRNTMTFSEVIPCFETRDFPHRVTSKGRMERPVYELNPDGSGRPYNNVLELRADKIHNFLDIENYQRVKSFRAVRYEQLIQDGTESLIRHLERETGLKAECQPFPPASGEVVRKAINKHHMNPDYVKWMSENVDWDAEGRIGYKVEDVPPSPPPAEENAIISGEAGKGRTKKPKKKQRKIDPLSQVGLSSNDAVMENNDNKASNYTKTIHLIGERHSGTNWVFDQLSECFGKQTLVADRLSRYKHWFQDERRLPSPSEQLYVVALFRNPYSWVDAMHRHGQHHFSAHQNVPKWQSFVMKPLMIARSSIDKRMTAEERSGPACIEGFTFNEVTPCHADNYIQHAADENFPMYELNNYRRDGTPYFRIIDLRADKIKNFLKVKDYESVEYFRAVQYEKMMEHNGEGLNKLIRDLEEATGLNAECAPVEHTETTPTNFDESYIQWMKENVDWETEQLVGYERDDVLAST